MLKCRFFAQTLFCSVWSDEDELRRYETEFFEWLGAGVYPDIPWKEYVIKKVSMNGRSML